MSDNLEFQRYGRNKSTLVNSTYISSGEYRNKFDRITDHKDVNRALYIKAKKCCCTGQELYMKICIGLMRIRGK